MTARGAGSLGRWWPREAVGALRLGLTVVVAIYLAMDLELAQPEWAGWSVLSVSLTTRAATLEKAAWRILGTLVGAVAAGGIVAAFAQDTLAFDVALAVWLAAATFLSTTAHRQDAYGFAIIGYTVPIVTLSDVSQPLSLFTTAVDRCSALALGIACATVAATLAARDLPAVRAALAGKMADTIRACLAWRDRREPGAAPFGAVFALDGAVVDAFTEAPPLRAGGAPLAAVAPALLGTLVSDLLAMRLMQRSGDAPYPPSTEARRGPDDAVDLLLGLNRSPTAKRLRNARATVRMLRAGRRIGHDRVRWSPMAIDRDHRLAADNALRTAIAVSLANAFWYVSSWPSGGVAVTWAALVSVLLSGRTDPTRSAVDFLVGAALADLVGIVAHYTILTTTGTFELLATVVLAIGILGAAGRADKRAASAGGFGIVVFSALEPLNVMQYDLAVNINGALGNLIGVGIGALAFAALPPPASLATRRRRARRRIAGALRAATLRPAAALPKSGRWCAATCQRIALLGPDGDRAVTEAQTLLLCGLLVIALRRGDDALGRRAGRVVIGGAADPAGSLLELSRGCGAGLQRRRLEALAVLAQDLPRGFPGLPVSGASA